MASSPLKKYTAIELENMVKNVLTNKELTIVNSIDASTNPLFPAASPMDTYWFSKSGRIGGESGKYVRGSNADARLATIMICVDSTIGGTYDENVNKWLLIQDNRNHTFTADYVISGYVLGSDESDVTIRDSILEALSKLEQRLLSHMYNIATDYSLGHLIKNSKSAFDIQSDGTVDFSNSPYINGVPTVDDPDYMGDEHQIINKKYLDMKINHHNKEFGVRRLINSTSTNLERIVRQNQYITKGSATGLTAEVGVDSQVVSNSFDNLIPWKYITRCTILNGTVTSIEGDPSFTTDGTMGEVYVRIPRFYQMHQYNPNNDGYEYWWISNNELPGYYLNPRFTNYQFIYIGAYLFNVTTFYDDEALATNVLDDGHPVITKKYVWDDTVPWDDALYWTENSIRYGVKGVAPVNGKSISDLHSILAYMNDSRYSFQDIWEWDILTYLMIIEFATLDIQSLIKGQCNLSQVSEIAVNGECDNIVASSGSIKNNTNGLNPFIYRGIENPFGTLNMFLDGIFAVSDQPMVCLDPSKYANSPTSDYSNVGFKVPTNNGYVSKMSCDIKNNAIKLPYEATGSSTTLFADYYTYNSGTCFVCTGGAYNDGDKCGMFNFNISNLISSANAKVGARLSCNAT